MARRPVCKNVLPLKKSVQNEEFMKTVTEMHPIHVLDFSVETERLYTTKYKRKLMPVRNDVWLYISLSGWLEAGPVE